MECANRIRPSALHVIILPTDKKEEEEEKDKQAKANILNEDNQFFIEERL